jgi:hypothetical protein
MGNNEISNLGMAITKSIWHHTGHPSLSKNGIQADSGCSRSAAKTAIPTLPL